MADEYSSAEESSNPRPQLEIDIVTLFPGMFVGPFAESMIARASAAGLVDIRVHDLRRWTSDRHRTADDAAYGGGGGMVMIPEPVFRAVEELLQIEVVTAAAPARPPCPVVLMTPQGAPLDHELAMSLALQDRMVIICGHYEGVDERIREHIVTAEVSVGDFVVTGGELPAMLVVEAVTRLRPGVLGPSATQTDSFAGGLLEHPHYTRPADFRGWSVPEVLVSGDHGAIARWRRKESLRRTLLRRPEKLATADLTAEDTRMLEELAAEQGDYPEWSQAQGK